MGWTEAMDSYTEDEVRTGRAKADLCMSMYENRGCYEPRQQPFVLFKDKQPFDNMDAAEDFLRHSDEASRYYREKNTGVRYYDYENIKPSKKILDLKRRIEETKQKMQQYEAAHSVQSFKAQFVGCPNCGSKIAKDHISYNRCPLCHTELRSKTTMETLAGYREKIKDLEKKVKEEEKKAKSKAEVKWLLYGQLYLG